MITIKYKPEDQPWILQYGGKNGRKLRGVRAEITKNACYYMLTQATDGALEAFPLKEWYNFQRVRTYKPISEEKIEAAMKKRDIFSNNAEFRNRMMKEGGDDDDDIEDGPDKKSTPKKRKRDACLDDDTDEMTSDDDDEDGDENKKSKSKKTRKIRALNKRRRRDSDEGDEGDMDGRERDYTSSSDTDESD